MNSKERVTPWIESSTSSVGPIEIGPKGQEIQKPVLKKTPLMLQAEDAIQENLEEFLRRSYLEGLTQREIVQKVQDISEENIEINYITIASWLRKFKIQLRSRSEASKLPWKDPDKRERIITQLHSPLATSRRSQSIREHWQNLSELEKDNKLRSSKEKRTLSMQRFMKEKLGEDPAERLYDMYWNRNLTLTEVAEELGIDHHTVKSWMKHLGIETRKPDGRAITQGYFRVDEEKKLILVEQARAQGFLEILDEKEQHVVNARYPIEGKRATFAKIAQELYPDRKVRRQYVQQLEQMAFIKLEAMQSTGEIR